MSASTVLPTRPTKDFAEASSTARRIHMSDEKKMSTSTTTQTIVDFPNLFSQSTLKTCLYCRIPSMHQMASRRYDSAESDSPEM